MKECFKCGKIKEYSEFYKHKEMADGYLNKCKECTKLDSRKNRKENIEYYREYDRLRGGERSKKYQLNKTEASIKSKNKWKSKNRIKVNAQALLRHYVKKGKIEKEPCEICGNLNVQAHHEDYNQPLVVIWLCPLHHKWIHCNVKNGGKKPEYIRKGYHTRSDNWYKSLGLIKKQNHKKEI